MISKNQIVYLHLYVYADNDILLVSAFTNHFSLFQHTFHSIFNETVSTFDHLLNLYHFIRRGFILKKHFPGMGKISNNG